TRCYSSYYLQQARPPQDQHSFPTRRSSDLQEVELTRSTMQSLLENGENIQRMAHRILIIFSGLHTASLSTEQLKQATDMIKKELDRKSTRLNSSHVSISYAVFCLKKKNMCVVRCMTIKTYKRNELTEILTVSLTTMGTLINQGDICSNIVCQSFRVERRALQG